MRRRFYCEMKSLPGEGNLIRKSKFSYEKKVLFCQRESLYSKVLFFKQITKHIQKTQNH